jgi:hypothetical protein
VASYFTVSLALAVANRTRWRWVLGWGLPTAALPLVIAGFGGAVPGWGVVVVLMLVALWRVSYGQGRLGRRLAGVPS